MEQLKNRANSSRENIQKLDVSARPPLIYLHLTIKYIYNTVMFIYGVFTDGIVYNKRDPKSESLLSDPLVHFRVRRAT